MLLYRLFLTLAAPLLGAIFLVRVLRGRERLADLAQRLGSRDPLPTSSIWVHGASNGELASARPLILALRTAFPDRPLVVTSNTVTGRALVDGWDLDEVHARLAPLDLRWVLARFRARMKPDALIVLENELWPNRILTSRVPILAVAARMSDRSARRWQLSGAFARKLFSTFIRTYPQDERSAAHFQTLGVPPSRIGPVATLKSMFVATAREPGKDRATTVLAASTHAGEEKTVLEAFVHAHGTRPDLRLILAPRHPARRDEIIPLIRASGLAFGVRSHGDDFNGTIYLADTLGEMDRWYAQAGQTFVGGSLVQRGGHTPFEPAAHHSAILHGPHTKNFEHIYAALDLDGGAIKVVDARQLSAAMIRLAETPRQSDATENAAAVLQRFGGGSQIVEDVIETLNELLSRQPVDG